VTAATVTVLPDADAVARTAAAAVADVLRPGRRARIVLAGGTTPRRCYELLAGIDIPWGAAEILFGDERCVPPGHAESNYRLASEALLAKVAPGSVHRIPAELGPERAAELYAPIVRAAPLDLVLLGIGPDGHIASLFPGSPALRSSDPVVAVHGAPKPPPDRVTIGLTALNAARRVLILATGPEKADAVALARRGAVPAGLVRRADWLVSEDAAGGGTHLRSS
jgi:6-phosphogluconolactonase